MKDRIYMRLQTAGTYEVHIASVGGLPKHASGDTATVLLYPLGEVLYGTENLLIP